MNKILTTRNNSFESKLSYYLDLRKKTSNTKGSTVRKILKGVRKKEGRSRNKDLMEKRQEAYWQG